jgi:hypothetical protein
VTEAEAIIAVYDAELAGVGQDIILRRLQLVAGVQSVRAEVICRAVVRNYQPSELVGGIIQGDTLVILSPTQISNADWPGAVTTPGDKRVPKHGDQIVIQGISRAVQVGTPFYVAGTLVRLELQVRG